MLIDSHCHLDCLDFERLGHDLAAVLSDAKKLDVHKVLSVCIETGVFERLLASAKRHEGVRVSVGQHPNEVQGWPDHDQLLAYAQDDYVVALGETGLDYYRCDDASEQAVQREIFAAHIEVAHKVNKPIIVHTRAAGADTLAVLSAAHAKNVGGVIHCFTEDWDFARSALDMGFYIGFSGIITFKNAQSLRDVVEKVPMDRIVIETDAPYLSPVPLRGQTNQPANVYYVAQALAKIKQLPLEAIAQQTVDNTHKLFGVW